MGLKIQSPETDFFRLVTPAWNWTEMSGRMNDVAGRSTCLQLVQKVLEFIPIQSFSQSMRQKSLSGHRACKSTQKSAPPSRAEVAGRAGPRGIPAGLLVVKVQDGHARRLACSVSVGFNYKTRQDK